MLSESICICAHSHEQPIGHQWRPFRHIRAHQYANGPKRS